MKRIFGLLLCVLVVALVACSEDSLLTSPGSSGFTIQGSNGSASLRFGYGRSRTVQAAYHRIKPRINWTRSGVVDGDKTESKEVTGR